jgi:DNA gyrase/topoisomerase IV subunit A
MIDEERVIRVNIEEEMKSSYIDYSMSQKLPSRQNTHK